MAAIHELAVFGRRVMGARISRLPFNRLFSRPDGTAAGQCRITALKRRANVVRSRWDRLRMTDARRAVRSQGRARSPPNALIGRLKLGGPKHIGIGGGNRKLGVTRRV